MLRQPIRPRERVSTRVLARERVMVDSVHDQVLL